MLEINDLKLQQGGFSACFSLEVAVGEKLALVGESGSGKSTLLNLIAGFLTPEGGVLNWQGQSLSGLSPHQRPVTTLFQDNNLFSHLDVWHNIALGIQPSAKLSKAEKAAITETLKLVGLPEFEKRLPATLSGGQQQRVALARCLLRKQPLLLLDEPYSALDAETRGKMLLLTSSLVETHGLTLILVTHNPADAALIAARKVRVVDGIIQES